jgi:hypothetical protein
MANEVQGIMKRRGDGRHCVDLSNPNAFLYIGGLENFHHCRFILQMKNCLIFMIN